MKRKIVLIVVLAIAVFALCCCGGGHSDVQEKLTGNTWLYNGGSDTILNSITFGEGTATISQVTFDGNGAHDAGSSELEYSIDDSSIVVKLADGSELAIPYTLDGDTLKIGSGEYFTLEEIDAAIQGAWSTGPRTTSAAGMTIASQQDILFADGKVSSQNGTAAADGSGYYYNVYDPTGYSLGIGTFETDMMHGSAWLYNIIDGAPTILYYDAVCHPVDKLPDIKEYEKL